MRWDGSAVRETRGNDDGALKAVINAISQLNLLDDVDGI